MKKLSSSELTEPELIRKFIQNLPVNYWYNQLQWIPYEQFTNLKYLASGGFSEIYKARWRGKEGGRWDEEGRWEYLSYTKVVLKILNNSRNITSEFLWETAHNKLLDYCESIVICYGISQDSDTGNYIMVMDYKKEGDLRNYLKNNAQWLNQEDKIGKLSYMAFGLEAIHRQNLVHRDFHSGNMLIGDKDNEDTEDIFITDLGLSRPANEENEEGQIYGVLPYVAPEVLQGQPYTQASDIYSFGIIAYELLANSYPYPDLKDLYPNSTTQEEREMKFAFEVCQGLRPNLDKVPIPQLLKDLITRCWHADPQQRPSSEELHKTVSNWHMKIEFGEGEETEFYQQYLEIEKKYNIFSQKTPYQIHPQSILTSKLINTKQITQQLAKLKVTEEYHTKSLVELNLDNFNLEELSTQDSPVESSICTNKSTGLTKPFKHRLSLSAETSVSKTIKIENQTEPMDCDQDWTNIHPNFTLELSSYSEVRDWISIHSSIEQEQAISEPAFYAWLRDIKKVDSDWVLNHGNLEHLKQECQAYLYQKEHSSYLAKLNEQIKEIEREIQSFTKHPKSESIKLVEDFIDANKKIIKDKNDEKAREEITNLDKRLLEDNILSEEDIEKILHCCERLVDLEWQKEKLSESGLQEKLQNQIEIPPKK